MSTITKQWLQQKIADMEATRDDIPFGLDEGDSNTLAALRIAQASLEAEPVAQVLSSRAGNDTSTIDKALPEGTMLFTAPPAPVVPDERYQHLSGIYHAQEKRLFKLAQRIKGPSFDKYAHSPSQAIDVLESAIFGECEDEDCRAAMLQGAEPVSNRDELPDGWVACSERMPEVGDDIIVFSDEIVMSGISYSKKKGFYIQALEYDDDESVDNVTHWMPLPAAPQQ